MTDLFLKFNSFSCTSLTLLFLQREMEAFHIKFVYVQLYLP